MVGVPRGMRRDGTDVVFRRAEIGVDAVQVGVRVVPHHVLLPPHVRRGAHLPPLAVSAGLQEGNSAAARALTQDQVTDGVSWHLAL